MRTKRINSDQYDHSCYGDIERYEYECACGKGEILEEHDNIPGFRYHFVYMCCKNCNGKYILDTSNEICRWELIERDTK